MNAAATQRSTTAAHSPSDTSRAGKRLAQDAAHREQVRAELAKHAAAGEAARHLTPATRAVLQEAGAFGLAVPEVYGGAQASRRELLDVLTDLGAGCPSAAWVVGTTAVAKTLAIGSLGAEQASTLLQPHLPACGTARPGGSLRREAGRWMLSGRWPVVSGAALAPWAVLGAMRAGGPTAAAGPVVVVVEVERLRVQRDWTSVGMAATGSHTLVADDVEVQEASLVDGDGTDAGAVMGPFRVDWRFPILGAVTVLGPVLGAARAAVEAGAELLTGDRRPQTATFPRLADSAAATDLQQQARQLLLEAQLLADRALTVVDEVDATAADADAGGAELGLASLRARAMLARSAEQARRVFAPVLDLHGAAAFAGEHPLQRFWRDAEVASRHPLLNGWVLEEQLRQTQSAGATVGAGHGRRDGAAAVHRTGAGRQG